MLGGEIALSSEPGKGSVFTFYLPQTYTAPRKAQPVPRPEERRAPAQAKNLQVTRVFPEESPGPAQFSTVPSQLLMPLITDDRGTVQPGDRVVLIVEDDATFARLLQDMAHEKGFKALVTSSGEEAVQLSKQFPLTAITLDILLPDLDGWTVLDRIKLDPQTRHVPVHIISIDESQRLGLERGALAYIMKPVDRESLEQTFKKIQETLDNRIPRLLVANGSEAELKAISELIGNGDIEAQTTLSGAEALRLIKEEPYDCVVLSLSLEDMTGKSSTRILPPGISPWWFTRKQSCLAKTKKG
jgi:CheY-like chemotaxis protein